MLRVRLSSAANIFVDIVGVPHNKGFVECLEKVGVPLSFLLIWIISMCLSAGGIWPENRVNPTQVRHSGQTHFTRSCVQRGELLSPEECGAECLGYSLRAVPPLCAYLARIGPHALSALWAYCGGRGHCLWTPLLSALIDGNQTVTVCTAVIRPTGSQLADMCRLVELVMYQPDVISSALSQSLL